MSDIGPVETPTIPEGEKLGIYPLNQLDDILYQVATEDFKDNPSVLKVLAEISKRYFKEAESWRDWFSGQSEGYGGEGAKREALSRPTHVAHPMPQYRLDGSSAPDFTPMFPPSDRLRSETTAEIAEAIAKRLGVFDYYPDKHTLEDFDTTGQIEHDGPIDKIHILLDGKGTVLDKKHDFYSSIPNPKLILLRYLNDRGDRVLAWGIGFTIPVRIFDKSLEQPLTPSKFTTVPTG